MFLFCSIYWIIKLIQSKVNRGYFWRKQDSEFFGQKKKIYWFGVILDGIIYLVAGYGVSVAFNLAVRAEFNIGVMVSLFGLTSVFMAISGKIFFKEDLKPHHIVGLILIMTCVFLIAFKDVANGKVDDVIIEDDENE